MDERIVLIKKDPRFIRLNKAFKTLPYYNIPYEKYLEEINNLHSLRKVRKLGSTKNSFTADLIDANLQDQSYRSRLVEIIMEAKLGANRLKDALEALENYILMEYDEILRGVRTKDERKKFISIVMENMFKYIAKMEILVQSAELVVQDIDKAAYCLKLVVDTLKITTHKEVYV